MKNICYLSAVVLLVVILAAGTAVASRIEISSPGQQTIPLALTRILPVTTAQPAITAEFDRVLEYDLELSGVFRLLDPVAFLSDARQLGLQRSDVNFAQWRLLGAELLIKGGYELDGDQLIVDMRLYDVTSQRLLTGRRYRGQRGDLRKIAHTFADQVLEQLTGERGSFAAKIAYISEQTGHKELYLMDTDGHDVVRLTNHQQLVLNPDFSPRSKELIFTSYKHENPDLFRKEVYTGQESRLSFQEGLNISGRYSPDGRQIALTLSKDGNAEIYLMGTDGTLLRRLTNHYAIDVDPSWSPNGNRIAFVSDRLGNPHVFIVDIHTRQVKRLTYDGRYNATPAWNPKNDRIAFSRLEDGVFNIFTINDDGTDERQITFGPGSKEHPRWSPDGRLLVYSHDDGREKSIWMMRADGSGARKIAAAGGRATHPAWSGRW
ncbi:MAG: Tol-Pal system beta propeller repeat protein TolB [Pelovirga sp.]